LRCLLRVVVVAWTARRGGVVRRRCPIAENISGSF
jgi:hypothetical protein